MNLNERTDVIPCLRSGLFRPYFQNEHLPGKPTRPPLQVIEKLERVRRFELPTNGLGSTIRSNTELFQHTTCYQKTLEAKQGKRATSQGF